MHFAMVACTDAGHVVDRILATVSKWPNVVHLTIWLAPFIHKLTVQTTWHLTSVVGSHLGNSHHEGITFELTRN
jgi:hypothetical protein